MILELQELQEVEDGHSARLGAADGSSTLSYTAGGAAVWPSGGWVSSSEFQNRSCWPLPFLSSVTQSANCRICLLPH